MKQVTDILPPFKQDLLNHALEALVGQGLVEGSDVEATEKGVFVAFPQLGRYQAVFRTHLTPKRVGLLAEKINAMVPAALLFTDLVTPATAEALRTHNIQFIDTAGNAFLRQKRPNTFIWVQGRKIAVPRQRRGVTKAFREKGLRTIFPILCLGPVALDAPYRQLAQWAGVALGTVANTVDDLVHLGMLRKTDKKMVLVDPAKLIDRWVEAYPLELRPQLYPRRYTLLGRKKLQAPRKLLAEVKGPALGGEAAAAQLTTYLQPETLTLYGQVDMKALVTHVGQIAQDEAGPLEIVQSFWNFTATPPQQGLDYLCPPLLIYADLMASGEARQMETAILIREQYVDPIFN